MFFAGLFAMYFTIRSVSPALWQEGPERLDIPFSLANTTVLVLSSVWCQLGVHAAERYQARARGPWWMPWTREHGWGNWGMREWYGLTLLSGTVFVAGQAVEYAKLVAEGLTISSDAYGSVFFLTTGFHGLHVIGGLGAFVLLLAKTLSVRRFARSEAIGAIVVSYYWHFVDVVWIGLFTVIYILR
ncbi:MAG: heme-copper oxidase subunit III [Actinomycetales bacterium]|nr:heme-copper oxidase subunit III [Actinomycetales bacterium]